MITLYTTHCSRCRIIEMKLAQKKIDFTMVDDKEKVVATGIAQGILSAPILEANGKFYSFDDAIKFINEI